MMHYPDSFKKDVERIEIDLTSIDKVLKTLGILESVCRKNLVKELCKE